MMTLNFHPFPEITTNRVRLRQLRLEDAKEIFQLRTDQRVFRYIDRPPTKSLAEAELYIEDMNKRTAANEMVMWGFTVPPSDEVLGTICFFHIEKENYRGEIGYMLHADYHRKGLMKEALDAVIEYGFEEVGFHSIFANVNPKNEASIGILKKLGFQQEAFFKENYYFNGKFLDTVMFGLLTTSKNK